MKYKIKEDIKLISEYLSLSMDELAKEIGFSKEVISQVLNGASASESFLESFYSFVFLKGIHINESKIDFYKKNHDLLLYHGSKKEIVGKLSLSHSRANVDLGVGFYMGDNYHQSLDFVSSYDDGSVYVLDVNYSNLSILTLNVSLEWMLFIALNRGKLNQYSQTKTYKDLVNKMNSYDVIIAPIADNRMFTTIDDFVKSAINSEQAMHALRDLSLGKQIVFKTDKALKQIKILDRLYVSKPEKDAALLVKKNRIIEGDKFIEDAYKKYIRQGLYISEVFSSERDD